MAGERESDVTSATREAGGFPYPCYVISLDRTPQRLAAFNDQNGKTGLRFEKFAASDGNLISDNEAISSGVIKRGTTWRTKATLGVALSHRRLWEKAIAEDRPLVVFEDDIFIRRDFAGVVSRAMVTLPSWDIVLLGYNSDALVEFNVATEFDMSALFSVRQPTPAQLAAFTRSTPPTSLFPLRHAFGTSAYAISPAGARKLLARCFPMDNRVVEFKAAKNRFAAYSLDCLMNVFYRELAAYIFLAPVALPHNDWATSTVDQRQRPKE